MESNTTTGRRSAGAYPGRDARSAVDAPSDRPGVPLETDPGADPGVSWERPPRQRSGVPHLHRAGLDRLTPVWGTAQPPHGLSGMIRRNAYQVPEHYARHWMLLMMADRVDVVESRLGLALAEPFERIGFEAGARHARANPLAVLAGTLLGAWIIKKVAF